MVQFKQARIFFHIQQNLLNLDCKVFYTKLCVGLCERMVRTKSSHGWLGDLSDNQ